MSSRLPAATSLFVKAVAQAPGIVITALVTPFKNGVVDLESLRRVVRAQLDQGVGGFVVNGTTAESPCLKLDEVKAAFTTVRSEAGAQIPILIGTGSNSTAATIEATKAVAAWEPDGVLIVVPYYNRPPQRGLQAHFAAVADASDVPVVLYNVPSRTVTALDPPTVAELSRHPRIVAIKDASADMQRLAQMKAACAKDFLFLSGDDGSCVEFVANGGHGLIGVASHIIGREMGEAMRAAAGSAPANMASGRLFRERYAELLRCLYIEANPIPIKAALHIQGLITSAEMRLPLVELDASYAKELGACLKNLNK